MRDYANKFSIIGLVCLALALGIRQPTVRAENADLMWWNDRVFYEIFVRSFYDSDGDGIGDLRGVIEKLDYLNDGDPNTTNDLGVTGIWLMPIMESPSYHGYDVTDYRAIEPDYGTMADFQALLAAAHARGIAVIIDLVINHSSSQHPWFTASASGDATYADWYIWRDSDPGYVGPDGQRVWHSRGGRHYYGLFWSEMPDLNLENSAVTTELYDIARYWLDVGVDGFRLDAIKHLVEDGQTQENTPATLAWLRDFHTYVESVNPDALLVGEAWTTNRVAATYVPEGVDLVFDFDLATTFVDSAPGRNPSGVKAAVEAVQTLYPFGQYATFLTNHDQNRVMSEVRRLDAAQIAAASLLTTPGVPFIYYGEEIGMRGQKPDERIRTPMHWDESAAAGFTTGRAWQPFAERMENDNVAAQTGDPTSLLSTYRDLIHLRNTHESLRRGAFIPVSASSSRLLAFLRQSDAETTLVIVNFNDDPVTDYRLRVDSSALTNVDSAALLYGADQAVARPTLTETGGFADYTPVITLPPRSTTILALMCAC
jgi:glycosidase